MNIFWLQTAKWLKKVIVGRMVYGNTEGTKTNYFPDCQANRLLHGCLYRNHLIHKTEISGRIGEMER